MQIARVIGDITATRKHASHEGTKILLLQPLDLEGADRGTAIVALDSVNAGVGDRVLVTLDGYAAFTAVGRKQAPIDAAVIAVVDHVELVSAPGNLDAARLDNPVRPPAAKKKHKQNRP
jgi:ethanolamine utilization protein EutN